MANKGSFNTSSYQGRYLRFDWSIKSQSIANNETIINWSITGAGSASSSWYMAAPFKVVIDGATVYSSSTRIKLYEGTVVASGTKTIKHNTNGKKKFSASATAAIYSSSVNCSGSGSWDITDIPRAAVITSAPDFNDEETYLTINYNNAAGNNVDALAACISLTGTNDDISYREVDKTATSYTFELSEDDKKVLRKAVTKQNGTNTVKFYLRTTIDGTHYYNNVAVNYSLINFTPTITPTIRDIGGNSTLLTGNPNIIIKGFNVIEYDIGGAGRKEAYITNQRITCGSQTTTDANGTLVNVDSNIFELRVIDNRNTITEDKVTLTLIDYKPITCTLEASIALDGETTSKIKFSGGGTYWSGNFGALNNHLVVAYRLKADNSENVIEGGVPFTINEANNSYSFSSEIPDLDYKSTYTLQVIVQDKVYSNGIGSNEVQLSTIPIFDWSKEDFNFNVPISIMNIEQDYIVERGTSGMWTYEKWNSGIAKCWGTLTLNTPISKAWGSMYVGDYLMSRQNYPIVFTSKPKETVTLQAGSNAAWLFAESNGNGVNGAYASAIYNVCRPSATSSTQTFYLSFNVVGNWR